MVDPIQAEAPAETTLDDLAGAFGADIAAETGAKRKAKAAPVVAEEDDAEGGENEPESGETEGDESQVEAESESDDEPEETDEEGPEDQPARFRFKANGADVEATIDELTQSYSREADYTRKTQAHADEVRKWEATREETLKAERTELAAKRDQYTQVLGIWEKQLGEALGNTEDLARLRAENPGEWSAKMTERYELQGRLAAIQAEQAKLAGEDKTKRETDFKAKVAAEAQKTLDAIPEWKNPATYQEDSRKIFEYAKAIGYAPEEINTAAATDHRIARVLRDAAAFRALQDKKPAAVKKVEAAKPLPPGNVSQQPSQASKFARVRQNLAKRGHVDDLAEALKLMPG